MKFLLRLAVAAWIQKRRKARYERERYGEAMALLWIAPLYAHHGSDDQLTRIYHRMHWGVWPGRANDV